MASIIAKCESCGGKNKIPLVKQHLRVRCGKCGNLVDVMTYAEPVVLSDSDMDNFLRSVSLPVVVEFYSPTCGPCQTLAPHVAEWAKLFLGKIIIAKVDTGRNPGCTAFHKIEGVPTLLFFKGGEKVDKIVGLPDLQHLEGKLYYYAGGKPD